jgi:hypothetical protein
MTKVLNDYLTYAGAHLHEDSGWQIVYDFDEVQVSIANTFYTHGVELMVWGMFTWPLEYVTPAQALVILRWLAGRQRSETFAERPLPNREVCDE